MYDCTDVEDVEYQYATESYMGWCTTCKSFTRDSTEPDSEEYDCPVCEQNTVMGAEQALLCGAIDLVDTEEDP
jgi:Zn finger protein HypA/HybF involved in hydrogenase expression